jgi:3,4-dihydroxy-2-butanone 4-phosphate synthase
MEEQVLSATLEALRKGQCIAILDSKSKKAKIDLFFPTTFLFPLSLKALKTKARGELYIFVAHEIVSTFGFPFIKEVSTTHPQFFFFYF